jgi:glycosyltransferase involved in cell wall biosynthesis
MSTGVETQRYEHESSTHTDAASASSSDEIDVCYLINEMGTDGASKIVLNLADQASAEDVNFTVCYFGGDDSLRDEIEQTDARVIDYGAVGSLPQLDFRALPKMVRFFRKESFDVLHCHLPYSQSVGRIVGKLTGVEHVVSTQHNLPTDYHVVERYAERVTRPLDSATIAVSEGVQSAFTGESTLYEPGIDDQWITIPNGIDAEEFASGVAKADASQVREKWGLDDDVRLFLNVARYENQKRQCDLISAMDHVVSDYPNAHLLIVGWGPLESQLREQVDELGLSDSITVTGRVPEIHPYYAAADVFVSASEREGLPVTLLEAMAARCPVVATNIRGVREVVVEGETGYLAPEKRPRALGQKMVELATESELQQYGENGYQRLQHRFLVDDMVADHITLYRTLVSN